MEESFKQHNANDSILSVPNTGYDGLTVSLEYDLQKNNKIHFLLDYSKELANNKIVDKKILPWQVEKIQLLSKIGVHVKATESEIKEHQIKKSANEINEEDVK